METSYQDQSLETTATHTNNDQLKILPNEVFDGASTASSAREDMARLLHLITEYKGDIED